MSFTNSNKEFCGVQKLGDGRYAADFEVYVADVESTRLFKASIKKVPDDENYRRAASEFALTLPTLTKNTCIGTSDGVPIIYFIKQGMTSRWGSLTTTLLALALAAIQMVLSIYPPPKNLKANLRHKGNLEAELAKSEALGRPYGVFVSI